MLEVPDISDNEIQQLKDHYERRIKQVVTGVVVTLFVISFVLVGLSLSLGPKLDQLGECCMMSFEIIKWPLFSERVVGRVFVIQRSFPRPSSQRNVAAIATHKHVVIS